jgi:hypothetical protein
MKSKNPQARSQFFVQARKIIFHLKEVWNILFLVQFQQFLMCFLVVYIVHLRRFDLRFGAHFLCVLILIGKLFKLPSSSLCVSCVHYPLEEIWFKVWRSLSICPSSFKQTFSTCLLLCVLCMHCAFHQKIQFKVWHSFFCPSNYKPWLFICLLLCMLCGHYVHALDKSWSASL